MSSGEGNGAIYNATGVKTYIKQLVEKIKRIMSQNLRRYNSPEEPNYHLKIDKSNY